LRLCIFNVYDLPVPALTRANNLRLASTAGGCLHNGQGIAKLHALAGQKPAFSHFVARIFKKILAEQLAHFIR